MKELTWAVFCWAGLGAALAFGADPKAQREAPDPNRPQVVVLLDPKMERYSQDLESSTVRGIVYRPQDGGRLREVGTRVLVGSSPREVPRDKNTWFIVQVGPAQFRVNESSSGTRSVYAAIPYRLYYREPRKRSETLLFEDVMCPQSSQGDAKQKRAKKEAAAPKTNEELLDDAIRQAFKPEVWVHLGAIERQVLVVSSGGETHIGRWPNGLPVRTGTQATIKGEVKGRVKLWNRLPVEVRCTDLNLSASLVQSGLRADLSIDTDGIYLKPNARQEFRYDFLRAERKPGSEPVSKREIISRFPDAVSADLRFVLVHPDPAPPEAGE